MYKIGKFKLITVFCFILAIVFLGVYLWITAQSSHANIIHPTYNLVSDYGYAVAISEQNQDTSVLVQYDDEEIILPIYVFDCDCVIAILEEVPNSVPHNFIFTEVVPPIFDSVRGFSNGFAVVGMGQVWNDEMWRRESGLYGLIDREGNLVLPIIYDHIGSKITVGNCVFVVVGYDGRQGIINIHGDEILPIIYHGVSIHDNLASVSYGTGDDRTAGLFNLSTRQFVIPKGTYVAIGTFINENRAWVTLGPANGWRWGAVDTNTGQLLTPMVYTGQATAGSPGWFRNGIISANRDVGSGRKRGFLDIDGNEITQFIYDEIVWFGDDVAHVQYNGRWGIIDMEGNYIIEPMFDSRIWRIARGEDFWYLVVSSDGGVGLWDVKEGRMIVPNIYFGIARTYANYVIVQYGDWWTEGVLNIETGEYIIPPGYMHFGNNDIRNSLILASRGTEGNDRKMGLVNIRTGEIIVDFIYDDLRWEQGAEGDYIIFRIGAEWEQRDWDGTIFDTLVGGLFGIMDAYGNIIAPAIYSAIRYMHESSDLFAVQRGAKWGVINSNGEIVLPIEFTHIGSFWHPPGFPADLAPVNIGARWVWDNSAHSYDGFGTYVLRGGRWGFIDKSGNLVIPAELEYDLVYAVTGGMAAVMRDGKWGFVAVTPDI